MGKCNVRWLLGVCLGLCASAFATTPIYYVATNGNDFNNGISKSTPWQHVPGMRTWAGTYTSTPYDKIILRGCDVWTNANFPVTWTWSGNASSSITIDRDVTWYNTTNCPSSWNRPIFDAGSAIIQSAGMH